MIEEVIDFSVETDKAKLWKRLRLLKGKQSVEIKKWRKTRSLNQNSYMWAAVYPAIANGMAELWGESVTPEEAHLFCRSKFLDRPLIDRASGQEMGRIPGSTAILTTEAFAEYLNKCIKWAGEDLGIEIPQPGCAEEQEQAADMRPRGRKSPAPV